MSILSEDVITTQILTRLPVKSLIRFKCVCKSWMHILSKPHSHFMTSHINHTSQNPDNECLIMSIPEDSPRQSVGRSASINILSRSRLSYTRVDNYPQYHNMIGSINGLVCLVYNDKFLLWNPVTGLGKTISPPEHYWRNDLYTEKFYGLGWDCLESEYKVVVCYGKQESLQGVIYTSTSDSWNGLVVPDTFSGIGFEQNPAVIVKDCPYWTARDGSRYGGSVVKFESGINQFKQFVLSPRITDEQCYSVVNLKDRIVVLAYCRMPGESVHVFHLDEDCGDWSKAYTFEPVEPYYLNRFSLCFKYGGEFVCYNANMLYDPNTNRIKVIGEGNYDLRSGYSYTPSLVFLEGMEPMYTQSHWRPPEEEISELTTTTQSHMELLFGKYFGCLCWR